MMKVKRRLGDVNFLGRPVSPIRKHKHSQPIFGFKPFSPMKPQPIKGYPGINMFSAIAIPQRQSVSLWMPHSKPGAAIWGDSDGDGVYNGFDCQPNNRKKQGLYHQMDLNSTGPRGFGPEEWRAMQLESYKQTKKHPIREMATMGTYSDLAARRKITKMGRESAQEMINKTQEFDADQRESKRLEKEFKRSRQWNKKHPYLSAVDMHGVAAVMATEDEPISARELINESTVESRRERRQLNNSLKESNEKIRGHNKDIKEARAEERQANKDLKAAKAEAARDLRAELRAEQRKEYLEKQDEYMDKRAEHKKFMEERKEVYKERKDAKNVERIEKSQAAQDSREEKFREKQGKSNPSAQDLIDEVS